MHIGIIDLVTNSAEASFWGRMMHGNYAGIMPQSIAVWCEDQGHEVTYVCYAWEKDLHDCVKDFDLVFIGSFTQSAQLAYALSNLLRSRGAVTAMGGPHALSYPEDAVKYFDYVIGETEETKELGKLDPKLKSMLEKNYPEYYIVIIGDHPKDVMLSNNLNCPFIGVLTGHHSSEQLKEIKKGKVQIINAVSDLTKFNIVFNLKQHSVFG